MKDLAMGNNAFVKAEQGKIRAKMGDRPMVPKEMEKFDAYMSNNEDNVMRAGEKLCAGLEDAFPMK